MQCVTFTIPAHSYKVSSIRCAFSAVSFIILNLAENTELNCTGQDRTITQAEFSKSGKLPKVAYNKSSHGFYGGH